MTVGERIKRVREKTGMSQVDFADKINVSKQTLYKYENNLITNIPSDKIEAVAKVSGVSPAYLMGWESEEEMNQADSFIAEEKPIATTINVYGTVSAGIPLEMIEDIIDTEDIPEKMSKTGKFFGLRIKGDSMTPTICDGDVVIVRQQDDAETGDIVIATVNGEEATCKRLRKYKDGIELIAINPSYQSYEFTNAEILQKPVKILGKVVESRRKF